MNRPQPGTDVYLYAHLASLLPLFNPIGTGRLLPLANMLLKTRQQGQIVFAGVPASHAEFPSLKYRPQHKAH